MKIISFSRMGVAFSDFEVEEIALRFYNASNWDSIVVSTATFVTAIRVLIKEGKIPHDAIVFEFNGQLLHPNKSGRLNDWPTGFCHHEEDLLMRLL